MSGDIEDQMEDVAEQQGLFGTDEDFMATWAHWKGMPEFIQEDLEPRVKFSITFKFMSKQDARDFLAKLEEVVGCKINPESARGYWYPQQDIARFVDKRYRSVEEDRP